MKRIVAAACCLLALAVNLPPARAQAGPDIRLVLLIAIDQFRYDYLTRFLGDYSDGLKKLLTHGAVFTNANLEHYPTVTAVGHATMLSGATPSVSGIIGNDWFDRETASTVQSITDTTVQTVESETGGAASPRRLLVTTLGDQMKLASRFGKGSPDAPRVYGLSLKDRGAILPVGHTADGAYWYDTTTGRFITSTYYMSTAPEWVHKFNERKPSDASAGAQWTMFDAPHKLLHRLPPLGKDLYLDLFGSPFGTDLLLQFTDELLTRELLGQRNVTDLLSVSFSSNDPIGHTYGPDSPEVRDISIRTDRAIGRLLDRVDKLVGLDHTVVAFTSDHGVAPLPEFLKERGAPGGRMTSADLFDPIQNALSKKFGDGKWILSTAGTSPYLNYELATGRGLDLQDVRRVAAEAAMTAPHVTRVYTRDQLLRGEIAQDRVGQRVLRGFNAQRSGDLEIILAPFWIRQANGTTHGTAYNYDAHIPLILMGSRIKAGEYANDVALNDLAPTLATLLKVEIPSGSAGRVLTEALDGPTTFHAPIVRR